MHLRPMVLRVLGVVLVALAALTLSGHSMAQGRGLSNASDFRVRVQAALRLGKVGGPAARAQLERGLSDAHPAVRVACAAALGKIGDKRSIPALQHAARRESYASVKTAMREAVKKLKKGAHHEAPGGAGLAHAKYVVSLGNMRNRSGVRVKGLDEVMRQAAHARAGAIRGAYVVDKADASVLQRASKRHIPVLLLDGNLTRLTSRAHNGTVIVSARVDMSIRKIPQQTLKGMVSGNASASDDARSARKSIAALRSRAVGGAVESAMAGFGSSIGALVK